MKQTQQYSTDHLPVFIQRWKDCIESGGSPDDIAATYDQNATLKGTIADETVQRTEAIKGYFVSFTAGKSNATVTFDTLSISPSGTFSGEYTFAWDIDGRHETVKANYTFEATQGAEKISHHHSSFLPSERHA